jgi:glycine/D-amino acid oxidase-like deaminating enzyme
LRFLQAWPGWLDEAGIAYQWLDRDAMAAVTGSRLYQAGIRLPGYPLIHAGKLVRGLCANLPAGVELFEHSPVRAVHRVPGGGFRVDVGAQAPDGAGMESAEVVGTAPLCHLSAPRLLLATNGYLPSQRFFARRVFPCFTFGSMTRELTADEQAALGGEREWGLLAMDPMGTTVRRLRGQRLLIRNTAHYSRSLALGADLRQRMRAFHRQALRARYPELADIEFEYTWGGLMGTSHNSQILFGESEPGLFSAAAFNAAGIAMGTAAGELLAEMAAGQDSQLLRAVRALPPPTWMPPEPFRSWGGRFLVARKNALAADYI